MTEEMHHSYDPHLDRIPVKLNWARIIALTITRAFLLISVLFWMGTFFLVSGDTQPVALMMLFLCIGTFLISFVKPKQPTP